MPRGTFMARNRQWWAKERNLGDARKNAAAHLALMARRFVNDKANAAEVGEAIAIWLAAAAPSVQPAPTSPAKEPANG